MKFTTWQDVMIYIVSEELTDEDNPIDWISKRLSKARSTTYGYYEGRGEPGISEARDLHVDLVKDYDCHAVLQYIEDEFHDYSGNADGSVQDDMWNIHEQSTDAARFYKKAKNGDGLARQKFFDEIKKMEKEVQDLLAEWKRLDQ